MTNGDHISLAGSIWSGILTFFGGFFLLIVRKLWLQLDGKADRSEMNDKFNAIQSQMDQNYIRQDTRHTENLGRLDHITERIDTLINRTGGRR